jgi:hypothetical protein
MHIKHPHQSVLPLVILMLLETLNTKIQNTSSWQLQTEEDGSKNRQKEDYSTDLESPFIRLSATCRQ